MQFECVWTTLALSTLCHFYWVTMSPPDPSPKSKDARTPLYISPVLRVSPRWSWVFLKNLASLSSFLGCLQWKTLKTSNDKEYFLQYGKKKTEMLSVLHRSYTSWLMKHLEISAYWLLKFFLPLEAAGLDTWLIKSS